MSLQLPNLAIASQLIISDEFDWSPSIADWDLIIGADVNRWFIAFSAGGAGKIWVSTKPVTGVFKGIGVVGDDLREIDFQRYGPIAGAAWYGNDGGAGGTITVFTSKWNVTELTKPDKDF